MNFHDGLFAEGVDLIEEVHGRSGALLYSAQPHGRQPVLWDALSIGEVTIEEVEDVGGGEFAELTKVESLTVKIRGPELVSLKGKVQVADDPVRWDVESVRGGGTAVVTIVLNRPWQMEVGRAGRKR